MADENHRRHASSSVRESYSIWAPMAFRKIAWHRWNARGHRFPGASPRIESESPSPELTIPPLKPAFPETSERIRESRAGGVDRHTYRPENALIPPVLKWTDCLASIKEPGFAACPCQPTRRLHLETGRTDRHPQPMRQNSTAQCKAPTNSNLCDVQTNFLFGPTLAMSAKPGKFNKPT